MNKPTVNASPTAAQSVPREIGNREFLAAASLALAALAVSAVLLLALFVAGTIPRDAMKQHGSLEGRISGGDFAIHIGQGTYDGLGGLRFDRLSEDKRALASARVSIEAKRYPFVRYRLAHRHQGQAIYLIWRRNDQTGELFRAPLPLGESHTLRMDGNPQWQGQITEIGLEVYGNLRSVPLVLESLEFPSAGPLVTLQSLWSLWVDFPGWQLSSINHLAKRAVPGTVTEMTAAAAWAGLAVLILIWPVTKLRSGKTLCLAMAILIPWGTLDLLWQVKLEGQLEDARELFAGKSMDEKHLVDIDSDIYRHALRLKREGLPESVARIFLLHDSSEHNFNRLKTQYYLLPHNVFNFGMRPPMEAIRPGDYILVLGALPRLSFSDGRLHWKQEPFLSALVVDRDPLGTLYRVTGRPAGALRE